MTTMRKSGIGQSNQGRLLAQFMDGTESLTAVGHFSSSCRSRTIRYRHLRERTGKETELGNEAMFGQEMEVDKGSSSRCRTGNCGLGVARKKLALGKNKGGVSIKARVTPDTGRVRPLLLKKGNLCLTTSFLPTTGRGETVQRRTLPNSAISVTSRSSQSRHSASFGTGFSRAKHNVIRTNFNAVHGEHFGTVPDGIRGVFPPSGPERPDIAI